jgi:multidrug efflux pump subunit AcrA (membrane-fusion protein)
LLKAQRMSAEASAAQANAALRQAQVNLGRTRILSPVDGYVTNLLAQIGDFVKVGVNTVSLTDISGLPAGRTAPRSIHDHGLAVAPARDLNNMRRESLPHGGSGGHASGNSGRTQFRAADLPTLAMLKPP